MKIHKKEIPGYEILEVIATGGMGTVFKALQESLSKIVALKLLSPKLARDKNYVERFVREARSLAKLNHPNVVTVIDVGKSDNHYYLIMEFIEGDSLGDKIDSKGHLSEDEALNIIRNIGSALLHAQDNNLIHRDIKPDNILISKEGICKLCDLGLARPSGESTSLTAAGVAIGTPEYIAPEQARGESELDIRTDIYSLGATLFEAVTGETPFSGPTPAHIMRAHIDTPLSFPEEPQLSDNIKSLIIKMMSKDPDERQQNAQELLEDIDKVLNGEVVAERRKKPASGIYSSIPTHVRRNIILLSSAFVAAIIAIILLAIIVPGPSENPEETLPEESESSQIQEEKTPETRRRRLIETVSEPENNKPAEINENTSPEISKAQGLFENIKAVEDAGQTNKQEIIQMYRELIWKYPDTIWANKARERLTQIEAQSTTNNKLIEEEFKKAYSRAKELLKQERYHEAIVELTRFSAKYPNTLEAGQTRQLAEQLISSAANQFTGTCLQALRHAIQGDYKKGREILVSLKNTGISELDDIVTEQFQRISEIENQSVSDKQELKKNTLYGEFLSKLLERAVKCDIKGSLDLIKETRALSKFIPISDILEKEKEDLASALTVLASAETGLAKRVGSTEQLQYRNGGAIWGEIINVQNGRVTLIPRGTTGQTATVEISELEDRQIINFAAYSDTPASNSAKLLFFVARGNSDCAAAELPEATLSFSEKERLEKKIYMLSNLIDEKNAQELATQIETAFKSKKFINASNLAVQLYDKYAHTDYLVEHSDSIGRFLPQYGLLRAYSKTSSFKNPILIEADPLPSFAIDKSLLDTRSTLYVRWEGFINILENSEYTFYVMSSGQVKMEIDGRSVLRMNPDNELEISSFSKKLRKGMTEFQLEITCKKGVPVIFHLFWQREGNRRVPFIPTDVCYLPVMKDKYQEK